MKLKHSLPAHLHDNDPHGEFRLTTGTMPPATRRTRLRFIACTSLVGALSLLAPSLSLASTATSTMAVSATVVASCTVSTTPMAFGNYNSASLTSTATVTSTCSNTTAYNLGLNAGTASGATVTTRGMFVSGTPGVVLNYGLYSNSSRTTNWGMTIGTDTVTGTGSGAAQPITVYGQIPGGQLVAPGSYTDTITVTITY